MGNQESSQHHNTENELKFNLENSCMTYLHNVQNATVVKYAVQRDCKDLNNRTNNNKDQSPLFFLEKVFVCDSEQEYKILSKYIEKQAFLSLQPQSSEIIKIVKIYQESQKDLCSNRYFIKTLFEYSDITMRDELRIRSSKNSHKKGKTIQKHHFRYDDLCSIMFACISSLFVVEKMKTNLKNFIEKNVQQKGQSFQHLQDILSQYRYNIPLSLDRIIITSDGAIKVIHPLILDHQNRIQHSSKFFYSPQKMKDFTLNDGLKGRIFEIALIVLQCALIQNSEQMNSVYNGYCINENVINSKIQKAIEIYEKTERIDKEDFKLFSLIRKMTKTNPEQRTSLDDSIRYAQDLFQLNKKLKQSTSSGQFQSETAKESASRMSVKQLQFLPSHRMTMKVSPVQNLIIQSTNTKKKGDQKTKARQTSQPQTRQRHYQQNPEIQISPFNVNNYKPQQIQNTRQNTTRNPLESLFITNNDQQVISNRANEKCLQSLIGKGSDLYNTKEYNFLESKFEYDKNYFNRMKNSRIDEKLESNASSCRKYNDSSSLKQSKYKRLINQSNRNSSDRKYTKYLNHSIRQKDFLSYSPKQKADKSLITTSRFMDIDHIYQKYNFISKTNKIENINKKVFGGQSFVSIKQKQTTFKNSFDYIPEKNKIPFTFSLQNSVQTPSKHSQKEWVDFTNKKSLVIEKITPQQIDEKLKRNKLLR